MKLLRWLIVLAVVGYALWIAVPGVRALADQALNRGGPAIVAPAATPDPVEDGYVELLPSAPLQGEVAAQAVERGDVPVVGLWGLAIALYLLAAFLFANGNMRFVLAYAAAFGADLVLNLVGKQEAARAVGAGLLDEIRGWDPQYVVIAGAVLLGLAMLAARRPAKRRA